MYDETVLWMKNLSTTQCTCPNNQSFTVWPDHKISKWPKFFSVVNMLKGISLCIISLCNRKNSELQNMSISFIHQVQQYL